MSDVTEVQNFEIPLL